MPRTHIAYIPSSHLDLFWLGNYKTCLARGAEVIRAYIDRCLVTEDATFLLESVVFAAHFLEQYPDYQDALIHLVREGRVEVGAAYIDRWENLILGESHIRNVQIGKRWCREVLGLDNPLVTHPDLPGLVPQIAQIYAQAGIRYYVTSRKVYEHGAVWRYRSPDGSALLMLNWPRHYVYVPLDLADVPPDLRAALWVAPLDLEETRAGFPLGVIPISGSAGDLGDPDTFRQRYGASLEDSVTANRSHHPDITFGYTVPTQVLRPYDDAANVPEQTGEVPSVWGVAADEEVAFFQRDRALEGALLTAETVAAVADHLGIDWRPPTSPDWQGIFYEGAFFADKDPIPFGHELGELWRMHVFTQDHNGGGQEGALSTFQKRVIQERCMTYSREIVDHTLDQLARRLAVDGDHLIVFNPHGHTWSGPLTVTFPLERWSRGERVLGADGASLRSQVASASDDGMLIQVDLADVPGVGYRAFPIGRGTDPEPGGVVHIAQDDTTLYLRSGEIEVAVDRRTGNVAHIVDRHRGQVWEGVAIGRLYAVREHGSDVTLRLDPTAPPIEEALVHIDDVDVGPLFARIRVHKRLLDADVEQTITLWADHARIDMQTRVRWWGARHQQVRLALAGVPKAADITFGSPFYGVGWTDVVPSAGPRIRDEILPEDYAHYREVQGWLHLRGALGGLTLCTSHPAFHHDAGTLEAVLLRTSPSCGDARLFWENAGERVYDIAFLPGELNWRTAGAPLLGDEGLKPPVARLEHAGGGTLPPSDSLLRIEGRSVILSSLYPVDTPGATIARIYDAAGHGGPVYLSGPLSRTRAFAADALDQRAGLLPGEPGRWRIDLTPWRIGTVLFARDGVG